ncbi:hypothetical protein SAMN05660477_01757 [Soonwooa buanensis]|uniref:Uncharacterized protein n=1 Tax=Soonwooa buanensis TaxID=619805 RepID=A0A1T5F3A1_9FLAO|nr:hypothetical protein SAMN05660477_01757 [Soonwooa buanensis]
MLYILKIWFSTAILGAIFFCIFAILNAENFKFSVIIDSIPLFLFAFIFGIAFSSIPMAIIAYAYYLFYKKLSEKKSKIILSIVSPFCIVFSFLILNQDFSNTFNWTLTLLMLLYSASMLAMIWIFKIDKEVV